MHKFIITGAFNVYGTSARSVNYTKSKGAFKPLVQIKNQNQLL